MIQIVSESSISEVDVTYGNYRVKGTVQTSGQDILRVSVVVNLPGTGFIGEYYYRNSEEDEIICYQIYDKQRRQDLYTIIDTFIQEVNQELSNAG